ncbi:MAG: hypothetical protein M1383_05590 [Patescibacteria group bacterium]|nr:hypothetical protein [Patescibacteria group bacterium]
MFFYKNKTHKHDSRIRFQNRTFRRELEKARSHKREGKKIPDRRWEIFLAKIGLGSVTSKIILFSAIALAVYVIYIPNWLYIKQVNILGAKQGDEGNIARLAGVYLQSHKIWPQKNMLLLNGKNLAEFLSQQDQNIIKVEKIEKKYRGVVNIFVQPRRETYLLIANSAEYGVSNDGRIISSHFREPSSTPAGLIPLKISDNEGFNAGQKIFTESFMQALNAISSGLPAAANSQLDYFEMANLQSLDLNAYLKSGYKLVFDVDSDATASLENLKIILNNTSQSDKNNLKYVDLRLKDKGYVCLKTAPCAKIAEAPVISTGTASSTLQAAPLR